MDEEDAWREDMRRMLEEDEWRGCMKRMDEEDAWREYIRRMLEEGEWRGCLKRIYEKNAGRRWMERMHIILNTSKEFMICRLDNFSTILRMYYFLLFYVNLSICKKKRIHEEDAWRGWWKRMHVYVAWIMLHSKH